MHIQILLIEELARNGVETLFIKAPQGDSAEKISCWCSFKG
jgi:hypothetical protein